MSKTKIEWCARPGTMPETWNPTTGCNKVSPGCKNCYAEKQHARMMHMHPAKYSKPFLAGVETHDDVLLLPLKWKKPRTVFVNSMSDLFHKDVPDHFIHKVFAVMVLTPQHTYQLLTKRPERMLEYLSMDEEELISWWEAAVYEMGIGMGDNEDGADVDATAAFLYNTLEHEYPRNNIWLGTSVENQTEGNTRIPLLLQTPAAVRFLSCEPLLGPVDLQQWLYRPVHNGAPADIEPNDQLHWVITGGESGHNARPMHPDWARSLRDQCVQANVPFFFKQWGEWLPFEETAQPPFWRSCSNGEEFDAHGMNMVDPETGNAGKWQGRKWYDTMDAIQMSIENENDLQINFLKMGKHASGRLLDGKEWNEFPQQKK